MPSAEGGKREQSTLRLPTSATACLKWGYDGLRALSAQSRPDCQPPSPSSSTSWKLKNAPTPGWQ
jgi:hypothetical protein